MICPKCGKKMKKDQSNHFCIFCGYLENGNIVCKNKEELPASDLEIYFGKYYDQFYRNQNTALIFFLGPLYFCYLRHFFMSLVLIPINFLFYFFCFFCFPQFPIITFPVSFLILRIFYMTISNMIYLKLTQRKLDKQKKKDPANYHQFLLTHKIPITSFLQPVIVILLLLLLYICFELRNVKFCI